VIAHGPNMLNPLLTIKLPDAPEIESSVFQPTLLSFDQCQLWSAANKSEEIFRAPEHQDECFNWQGACFPPG